MSPEDVRLVGPDEITRGALVDYIEEFRRAGENYWQGRRQQVRGAFAGFLREQRDRAAGRSLPADQVPDSQYFLLRGGRILASCRIRHKLTDSLREEGGHIGYDVRPGERGKGWATRMLYLALAECRRMGMTRAMVTCDKTNLASARVIQKNGGVLESEGPVGPTGKIVQRYWIEL